MYASNFLKQWTYLWGWCKGGWGGGEIAILEEPLMTILKGLVKFNLCIVDMWESPDWLLLLLTTILMWTSTIIVDTGFKQKLHVTIANQNSELFSLRNEKLKNQQVVYHQSNASMTTLKSSMYTGRWYISSERILKKKITNKTTTKAQNKMNTRRGRKPVSFILKSRSDLCMKPYLQ